MKNLARRKADETVLFELETDVERLDAVSQRTHGDEVDTGLAVLTQVL